MKFLKSNQKGFTLIELLVVVSIISLLSSLALASLNQARDKAKWSTFKEELRQTLLAVELYRSDNGGQISVDVLPSDVIPGYIKRLPNLPFNQDVLSFYFLDYDPVTGDDPRYMYIVANEQDYPLNPKYTELQDLGWTYDGFGYYLYLGP